MNQVLNREVVTCEVPVRLEQLDVRLKALVKTKLREFIHLTPVFQSIPTIGFIDTVSDMSAPLRINGEIFYDLRSTEVPLPSESECPNRPSRLHVRRRMNRAVSV